MAGSGVVGGTQVPVLVILLLLLDSREAGSDSVAAEIICLAHLRGKQIPTPFHASYQPNHCHLYVQFVWLADGKPTTTSSVWFLPTMCCLWSASRQASYSWGGVRFLATPCGTLFLLIAIHLHDWSMMIHLLFTDERSQTPSRSRKTQVLCVRMAGGGFAQICLGCHALIFWPSSRDLTWKRNKNSSRFTLLQNLFFQTNKLASLEATLVRNYDPASRWRGWSVELLA